MKKAEIKYPLQWTYRIIGTDENELRKVVINCLEEKKIGLTIANKSSKGKYLSLNFETLVASEEERDKIFNCLKSNPAVKMII